MTTHQPHPHHALHPSDVQRLTEPGRHADGNGLYLVIDDSGARRWVLRVTIHGRRRDIGLGSARLVPLADAREVAATMRRTARSGGDPLAERRLQRRSVPTFREASAKVHAATVASWKSKQHAGAWLQTLETHAFPILANRPVDQITTADVLRVLAPIWLSKAVTAKRVRQRMRMVLDWARVAYNLPTANPVDGVERALPKQTDSVEHRAAMPYSDVPAFVAMLRGVAKTEQAALALEFLILTASRPSEVFGAVWTEIDWDTRAWTIPAERMKASEVHNVPLTDRMIAILKHREDACGTAALALSRTQAGAAFATRVVSLDPASEESRSDRPWVPLIVPRLGGGRNHRCQLRGREGTGACGREQGGSRLPPRRSDEKAPRADGRLVGLLLWLSRCR